MIQRILKGEWPVCHFHYGWMNNQWAGVLCIELRWAWHHYHSTHGLPETPWFDQALADIQF